MILFSQDNWDDDKENKIFTLDNEGSIVSSKWTFSKRPVSSFTKIKSFGNFWQEYPRIASSKSTLKRIPKRARLKSGRNISIKAGDQSDKIIINLKRPVTAVVSPRNL